MPEELWNELRRLRDTVHELRGWRGQVETQLRLNGESLATLTKAVGDMAQKDEIADAVAHRLNERRGFLLKRWQAIVAGVGGMVTVAAAIVSLFHNL